MFKKDSKSKGSIYQDPKVSDKSLVYQKVLKCLKRVQIYQGPKLFKRGLKSEGSTKKF